MKRISLLALMLALGGFQPILAQNSSVAGGATLGRPRVLAPTSAEPLPDRQAAQPGKAVAAAVSLGRPLTLSGNTSSPSGIVPCAGFEVSAAPPFDPTRLGGGPVVMSPATVTMA